MVSLDQYESFEWSTLRFSLACWANQHCFPLDTLPLPNLSRWFFLLFCWTDCLESSVKAHLKEVEGHWGGSIAYWKTPNLSVAWVTQVLSSMSYMVPIALPGMTLSTTKCVPKAIQSERSFSHMDIYFFFWKPFDQRRDSWIAFTIQFCLSCS